MAGVIYLVATPIGNLEDITLRALRVMREVDLIACEDSRHTGRLLKHFEVSKILVSYHEHNEMSRVEELVARVARGESVAVVSDAGTPAISDPGYRLVRAALDAGLEVISIPGPSAAIAALVASGLATDRYQFEGFLPSRKSKRRSALEAVRDAAATVIFYETPHRIVATLQDVFDVLGDRQVVVARELTKLHEEFLRGRVSEVRGQLASRPVVKGEMVLMVAGKSVPVESPASTVEERVAELVASGSARMDAMKQVAKERGLTKREVYSRLESSK